MESNDRVLIGTIGYHFLGNHSVGPILIDRLKDQEWPAGLSIEEMNWGPIAIVQMLEAMPEPYQRIILLTAIERPGRVIGDITIFQWKGGLPDERQIQACVGDAATGVISAENLLVIGEHFGVWPEETFMVDVEPGPEKAQVHLTEEVAVKVPDIIGLVRSLAIGEQEEYPEMIYLKGNEIFD